MRHVLEAEADKREQNSLRHNLGIQGIPKKRGEKTNELVATPLKKMGISDIVAAQLGRSHQMIRVALANVRSLYSFVAVREEVFRARTELKVYNNLHRLQRLKQVLTAAPVLAFPESDSDFIVDDVGIGCVLSQVQGGNERVIAYYSRTVRKTERN